MCKTVVINECVKHSCGKWMCRTVLKMILKNTTVINECYEHICNTWLCKTAVINECAKQL